LPKNIEKVYEFRVINRIHNDGADLVKWFGLDLPDLNPDVWIYQFTVELIICWIKRKMGGSERLVFWNEVIYWNL